MMPDHGAASQQIAVAMGRVVPQDRAGQRPTVDVCVSVTECREVRGRSGLHVRVCRNAQGHPLRCKRGGMERPRVSGLLGGLCPGKRPDHQEVTWNVTLSSGNSSIHGSA
eukprot:2199554-Rhodomonas_salina.1